MLVYCAFPGAEKCLIVLLLVINASLVFNLCKLSSSFFVHFVLQVTAHCPITLAYLSKNVSLVSLFSHSSLHCLCLVSCILSSNLCFVLL